MNSSEKRYWNFIHIISVRFIFLYIVLYIYPYGFEYIQEITTDDFSFWRGITIWFGEFILGWEFDKENLLNGFDSKYDYSRFLLITTLSVIGTMIWMLIDSKLKIEYNLKLKTLTRTILRYHVGLTLIIYGIAKVFMLQFGEMDLDRLETPIGDNNGMSYLWAFMSYSKFYTMTTGWIEVIGGIFLLFRRTTFIGSFILLIAMLNVVLIDIGYDVRVKMFAIHLLVMTILLISHDFQRIWSFFISNKTAKPTIEQSLFSSNKSKKIGYAVKSVLLLYFAVSCATNYTKRIKSQTGNRYPTLSTFHEVETHIINGDTLITSHTLRWENISINGSSYRPESIKITGTDKRRTYYSFEADTIHNSIKFYPYKDPKKEAYQFIYKKIDKNTFVFKGSYQNDSIWIQTKAKTLKDYRLTKNGIRWITDLK